MSTQSETEIRGWNERKTKWEAVKEELLGQEANYTKLKENLAGYLGKEKEINEWIRKAEDVCERMKDIEQGENSEEIFKTFEVGSNSDETKSIFILQLLTRFLSLEIVG